MQTIYKYPISPGNNTLSIPKGGRVLFAESQGADIVLYAMIDPKEQEMMSIQVEVYGTGFPIDTTNLLFLRTVKLFDGGLMFHVFVRVQ